MNEDVVIVSAARTAVGAFGGSLSNIPASELGAKVIAALLQRSGLQPDQIDEVIMGQVLTGGVGQNPARQAALSAGIPETTPAMTINKVCGSGLKAVHLALQSISVLRSIDGDPAKINVSGGAIALGHPIGASGARILVTLLHGMQHRNANKGLATLCIGGGQGVAMAVERIET